MVYEYGVWWYERRRGGEEETINRLDVLLID